MITVADAASINIDDMGLSLCGLLSGDKGEDLSSPDDDCRKDPGDWPNPPDTKLQDEAAFSVRACFSLSSTSIVN